MPNFSSFWRRDADKNASVPRIVFTDGTDPRVVMAVSKIAAEKFAAPILLGPSEEIKAACRQAGIDAPPAAFLSAQPTPDRLEQDAQLLLTRQAKRKISIEEARNQAKDSLYQGIAMLLDGRAVGMVAGSLRPTADIVRAALQCIGPKSGQRFVSGHFLIETEQLATADGTPFLFADCAVMPEPSPRALAAIARGAAASYRFFTGKEPRVALLSFSTRGSAEHELVDRLREAVKIVREEDPALIIDGEIQLDAALDTEVARIKKAADSPLGGRANVLVFPTLEAGNIGYKLVQRFGRARIAGPLLWGLDKPVSDLSRGCTTDEIVDTAFCLRSLIQEKN